MCEKGAGHHLLLYTNYPEEPPAFTGRLDRYSLDLHSQFRTMPMSDTLVMRCRSKGTHKGYNQPT